MEDIIVTVLDTNYIPEYETKEEERRNNEEARVISEEERIQNENTRIANEEARQTNETNRIAQYNLIQSKLDNGDFNGEDGYSPTVITSKADRTTTITITDKNGEHTATILDGEDGSASGDMLKSMYDTNDNGIVDNAEKVNNHTVQSDVPANAVFTDTVFSGNYNDLTNKPSIPSKTSDLTNDAGYLTSHQDISGKQDTLVSGSNIKTINNESILGNGNIEIQGGETEAIYLGDVTDFTDSNYLDLNKLKKGYYLISCSSTYPRIGLKVKNGENEILGYCHFTKLGSDDRLEENIIYLHVEKEIPSTFDTTINFGNFSYETYNERTNSIQHAKNYINISANAIAASSVTVYTFNLSVVDKAQTISGKKTFTTLPESSVVPTTDDQLVNKKYVDDNAGGGGASYTAGTNIEITSENVINDTIPYNKNFSGQGIYLGSNQVAYNRPTNTFNVVIGNNLQAGYNSETIRNIIIGDQGGISTSERTVENSIAIGMGAYVNYSNSISIGRGARATESNQAIFGSSVSPINKIEIYTSNGVKEMATQEFVQNYLTTVSGYDSTKTQVLKNVNGTMTWVDE